MQHLVLRAKNPCRRNRPAQTPTAACLPACPRQRPSTGRDTTILVSSATRLTRLMTTPRSGLIDAAVSLESLGSVIVNVFGLTRWPRLHELIFGAFTNPDQLAWTSRLFASTDSESARHKLKGRRNDAEIGRLQQCDAGRLFYR